MTQQERKIAAINKILLSTEIYIKKNGINNLDINEICREAGFTKGAFYHHFKNKQHLLLELLNKWINNITEQVKLPDKKLDTIDLIIYVIEKISPAFEQSEKQLPIFLELYIKAINDKNLKEYVLQTYDNFLLFFTSILKYGMEKRSIKSGNPLHVSKILFAITLGLLIQGLIDPTGEDWNELAKTSIKMLLSNKYS
ncbi:MAG: TetR/AcrR family transcriptional regulator [Candidatus Humimicrobiaceae bacterium]